MQYESVATILLFYSLPIFGDSAFNIIFQNIDWPSGIILLFSIVITLGSIMESSQDTQYLSFS